MVGKVWQRLVKEAVIRIERRFGIDLIRRTPIFYFAYSGDIETLGHATQILQTMPQIPWPDNDCIIFAEDVIPAILCPEVKALVWFIHHRGVTRGLTARPDESELVTAGAVYLVADRISHVGPDLLYMEHIPQGPIDDKYDFAARARQKVNDVVEGFQRFLKGPIYRDRYFDYLMRVCVVQAAAPMWVAYKPGDKTPNAGLAADFLACLSNTAIPCHYLVKTTFGAGFGPTGALQRLTATKPFFTIINYDRLHTEYERKFGPGGGEVPFHWRRGHPRYLWLQGIPPVRRRTLPRVRLERIKIAIEHKVPVRYIFPTWVGEPNFESDGVGYEVMVNRDDAIAGTVLNPMANFFKDHR